VAHSSTISFIFLGKIAFEFNSW